MIDNDIDLALSDQAVFMLVCLEAWRQLRPAIGQLVGLVFAFHVSSAFVSWARSADVARVSVPHGGVWQLRDLH